MTTTVLRDSIQTALTSAGVGDFSQGAQTLLEALGYRSQLTLPGQTGNVEDFIASLPGANQGTKTEQEFLEEATSARILFQITDEEIRGSAQGRLFETSAFSYSNSRSLIFAAVELNDETYPRGRYAAFTREINKRFSMPAVVLFRASSGKITLAFVHRRANKRDSTRDVLGSVSLVREIDPPKLHRAHVDILSDITLDNRLAWMKTRGRREDFDGLLAAWLAALDTEELNKRFYRDMIGWFDRAVGMAKFPANQARTLSANAHVIRLITRLLFVWFIKEKGLVDGDLFIEERVSALLKDYDPDQGDSYYRTVLQNLFFATLNTEMNQRGFSLGNNSTHRNFSFYRYRKEMSDPDRLLELFKKTPFINGGLFDCLDSFDGVQAGGFRIDCFTDNPNQRQDFSIPNRLFFDQEKDHEGLITIFDHYKFTVEENTPVEQEVALDPELLGKVFEHLLAVNTEETKESARKQTGSYYTPRPVVDYMVDEALVEALAGRVNPGGNDAGWWRERLLYLLDYNDAFDDAKGLFTVGERQLLVKGISSLRVLDPAVGSGAFPMGILHKLTLALRRLDPNNEEWKSLQIDQATQRAKRAFGMASQEERERGLDDIKATFERYSDKDFGRKLFLVQNCIYGVDIQPVATQISKLRFFITLAIEQEPDPNAPNFGMRPLPNLETKFVTAKTLLGLEWPPQLSLGHSEQIESLWVDINANREMYFHATNRKEKQDRQDDDKQLRGDMAAVLQQNGFSSGDAAKLAEWDPFDQNITADWFSPEYTFGVEQGFDVVIGNPPYVQLQKNSGKLGNLYKDAGYETFARTGDIYYLFYERGMGLIHTDHGHLCLITSNQWLKVDSAQKLRRFVAGQNPRSLVNLGANVFDTVTVNTNILTMKRSGQDPLLGADVRQKTQQFPPTEWTPVTLLDGTPVLVLSGVEQGLKSKMEAAGTPLKQWGVSIKYGVKTGYDKAFIVDDSTRSVLITKDSKFPEIIKPILRGRDIERYNANRAGLWLIDSHNGYGNVPAVNIVDYSDVQEHLNAYYPQLKKRQDKGKTPYNLRSCAYHESFEEQKIVWGNLNIRAKFAYAPAGMFVNAPSPFLTPYRPYLLAMLNSKLLDWYFRLIGVERAGEYYEYKPMFIERLPIPEITTAEEQPFGKLVNQILTAKAADPLADTGELEADIDRLVYKLYGLTEEEIAVVEGSA